MKKPQNKISRKKTATKKTAKIQRGELWIGDNLPIMLKMPDAFADLIYLDPPFNSRTFRKGKTEKHSFNDTWTKREIDEAHAMHLGQIYPAMWQIIEVAEIAHGKAMHSYLEFMASRLVQIHRLLKPTGSIYLHCDPAANYYLRLLMDCIFGAKNWRNEIVWCYQPGSCGKKDFGRKHDTILRYSKSDDYSFNADAVREPYSEKTLTRLQYRGAREKDVDKVTKRGGRTPTDYWYYPSIQGNSKEATGYATQKPLALLRRIIAASSNEGEVVLDPFCGCATACVAAGGMYRQWVGIDQNKLAAEIIGDRFKKDFLTKEYGELIIPGGKAKLMKPVRPLKTKAFPDSMSKAKAKPILIRRQLQAWGHTACVGCWDNHGMEGKNLTVDHIVPQVVGGPDRLKNYQLLCTPCNSAKGDLSMDEFLARQQQKNAQQRLQMQQRLAKVSEAE